MDVGALLERIPNFDTRLPCMMEYEDNGTGRGIEAQIEYYVPGIVTRASRQKQSN